MSGTAQFNTLDHLVDLRIIMYMGSIFHYSVENIKDRPRFPRVPVDTGVRLVTIHYSLPVFSITGHFPHVFFI